MQIDQRLPRYQQLRDMMLREISCGRWTVSAPIPSEAELGARYKLAPGTVRKAIDSLVAEGLLERFQGKGTFLRRPTFAGSLFRFFRFGRNEGEVQVPQSRILYKGVADLPVADAGKLGVPQGAQALYIQRLRLIDAMPVLAEDIWLPLDKFSALVDVDVHYMGDLLYPIYEQQCNQVVALAQETLTAKLANEQEADWLASEPGAPLIAIERLARNYCGQPLELRRSVGLAAKFRYEVTIR